MRWLAVALGVSALACRPAAGPVGHSRVEGAEPTPPALSQQPSADAGAPVATTPTSRYRVGDWVTYQYTGQFSEDPVSLREEVVAQDGLRLRIRVTITRGAEQRRFEQVVTDTPENRNENKVDELIDLDGDTAVPLANEGNKDLLRLYAWTLPPCEGKQSAGESEMRSLELAGARFECKCSGFEQTCGGKAHHGNACECPKFLWTHGSASLRSAEDDEELWRVEVEDFGPRR